jgi:hypothetical protein
MILLQHNFLNLSGPVYNICLDYPHSFSFIFYFKTEYSIFPFHILSFIFYSAALIFL